MKTVPCWVQRLSDEEAEMALVTDNTQSELKPIEIGLHALQVVGKGEKGRGKQGEYSEYARAIGKTKQYVSLLAMAAQVFESIKTSRRLDILTDYHNHLSEIAKAPESLWPVLAKHFLASLAKGNKDDDSKAWTVKDARHWVGKVNAFESASFAGRSPAWDPLAEESRQFGGGGGLPLPPLLALANKKREAPPLPRGRKNCAKLRR